jgi:hypothetical protein
MVLVLRAERHGKRGKRRARTSLRFPGPYHSKGGVLLRLPRSSTRQAVFLDADGRQVADALGQREGQRAEVGQEGPDEEFLT